MHKMAGGTGPEFRSSLSLYILFILGKNFLVMGRLFNASLVSVALETERIFVVTLSKECPCIHRSMGNMAGPAHQFPACSEDYLLAAVPPGRNVCHQPGG
jgi:hypothetical protein